VKRGARYGRHSCGGDLLVVDTLPGGRLFVECESCDVELAVDAERTTPEPLDPRLRGDYDF
jgi:hypothetical protein